MSAIAAIHVARKQLGLGEDATRDLYGRVTGMRPASRFFDNGQTRKRAWRWGNVSACFEECTIRKQPQPW
jgi:hypothetical protein